NMKIMGVFASVAGSNVGAYLTPVGALAGIMCVGITNKHGVKFGFLNFAKYGVITAVPTIFAVIGGLYISALYIL
ncbi:MAG: ArsB/NhaD family transporter, partial [Christensenellales bacterium]